MYIVVSSKNPATSSLKWLIYLTNPGLSKYTIHFVLKVLVFLVVLIIMYSYIKICHK